MTAAVKQEGVGVIEPVGEEEWHSDVGVLFADLDGTTRWGPTQMDGRFVNSAADVTLFPEAVVMMRRWRAGGGRIVGVTNQGGVALGHLTQAQCTEAILRTAELAVDDDGRCLFDVIECCMHHPRARGRGLVTRCWCRKPAPAMLITGVLRLEAAHADEDYPLSKMLMVGDRPEDAECARRVGVEFMPAQQWRDLAGVE